MSQSPSWIFLTLVKSMALSRLYADEIRKQFFPLYASFPPSSPLQLGDYGTLSGNVFQRVGNVRDLGIQFQVRLDDSPEQYKFTSASGVTVEFHTKGSGNVNGVANARAGLTITFKKENSVFFNAADGLLNTIEDQATLATQILALHEQRRWNFDHVVITGLVQAGSSTVVVSASSESAVSFEATADTTARIDLADASIGFATTRATDLALELVAKSGSTPLLLLSKVKTRKNPLGMRIGIGFESMSSSRSALPVVLEDAARIADDDGPVFEMLADQSDIN